MARAEARGDVREVVVLDLERRVAQPRAHNLGHLARRRHDRPSADVRK